VTLGKGEIASLVATCGKQVRTLATLNGKPEPAALLALG